ncbi:MAG: hypothetical protein JHC26_01620 [Thermofilum sp.]|jgi:hypothetical protein|uniref:hypothetical protein n=1 Tax=Thermofilum sp. TaxID=1961369 RepID=UPI00258B2938|nr:hypothetical protein [Thermofilum sp.]MCI4407760.1 hypothetical protein [Thermofilum sp.]
MRIEYDNRGNIEVTEQENEKELVIKKTTFPMSGYGNHYYDGITFEAGSKKVRVSSFGGGYGWARRGSMYERWDNENIHYISIEEYKNILEKLKAILSNENDVDREAELTEFVNGLLRQHL